jgi:hypothetical protein
MDLDLHVAAQRDALRGLVDEVRLSMSEALSKPTMNRRMTRLCLLSSAMTMIVAISPGPRYGRQSLKHARNTAMTARMKVLPPLLPTTSRASVSGRVGGVVRPVNC